MLNEVRSYWLGFEGERFVAEELNQLLADGYRVFHDVPFDNYNIDHVIVGPTGLFVVETKTRRKPVISGEKQWKVVFDGTALNFPQGRHAGAVEQVRRNVTSLCNWLTSATADFTTASAIVAIPDWWVERSAPSDIFVTNPKQIRSYVLNHKGPGFDAARIQRAAHQLEERSKLFL